ncbi:MAG TPA: VWA domain-containing protein [bacterium]|nr:VWA domain-containing protein [bacterium]HQL61939.1 VWA domain-containing protein [bacterium]
MFDADELVCMADIDLGQIKAKSKPPGRKSDTRTLSRSGRYVTSRPVQDWERPADIAIDATLRAAALSHAGPAEPFLVEPQDLCRKIRKRPQCNLVVFLVDASDSMGTHRRMSAAKGAILALLTGAYQKRDRVALVSFRGMQAEILLPPTTSVTLARERLRRLPTGGATPFADGLLKAWRTIQMERIKDPHINPLLVVVSDGDANVPLESGRAILKELCSLAQAVHEDGIRSLVIDTNTELIPRDEMVRIAKALDARYHHIKELKAKSLIEAVQDIEIRSDCLNQDPPLPTY